jgi:hypothetical protein
VRDFPIFPHGVAMHTQTPGNSPQSHRLFDCVLDIPFFVVDNAYSRISPMLTSPKPNTYV